MATQLEVIVRQAGKPDRVVVLEPGEVTIGRGEENNLVLADIGVSRRHARLHVSATGVTVEDLGSANGTWCRGQRIERGWPVQPGDILVIDPFSLELRQARGAPSYTPRSVQQQEGAVARLDVVRGPSLAQASYHVPASGLTIGRSEFRDLVVLDPAASRHHCDLVLEAGEWRLVDRGSSNGVHLNDERVTDAPIRQGDILRIGNTELRFHLLSRQERSGPTAVPSHSVGDDWDHDLSLPYPVEAETQQLDVDITPKVHDERRASPVPPPEPITGSTTAPDLSTRRPPWVALSLGAVAVGLIAVAATLIVGVGVMASLPRGGAGALPSWPAPHRPAWTLELPGGLPAATVSGLFDEGVQAMRERRPADALRAFYRVLQVEPGNRAAERWSFTAGEHLMLDSLKTRLDEATAEETARAAARDALLADLPRRRARAALKERFRDDPVVLARTGWAPSAAESALARQLDGALATANDGDLATAAAELDDVLTRTRNPVLRERATFARAAVRQQIARAVSADWRAGVEAELDAELDAARAAYRRVLEVDPRHPSARVRLRYLGDAPASAPSAAGSTP